ncbi:MAG TPA: hypothetical protein VM124_00325 [Candidatus Limnocylindrales bacterium]|nr:hypothetical protein [Candidatus Limnocylindrales bacterium]
MRKLRKVLVGLAVMPALAMAGPMTVLAAEPLVVSPSHMYGWTFAQEDTDTGSGSLVNGPGQPPLGSGSAELKVDATGREVLYSTAYSGTKLSDITTLRYSTYRQVGDTALAPSLGFDIDTDTTLANSAYEGRLTYEPYFTQAVKTGEWQTWNAMDNDGTGNWWFSRAPGNTKCPQSNPCTWAEVTSAFPNAAILPTGALYFKAGQWAGGFTGNVDNFTLGMLGTDTTYDFEGTDPAPPPTNKDQCKKDGWRSLEKIFKNQGDCVSGEVSKDRPKPGERMLLNNPTF